MCLWVDDMVLLGTRQNFYKNFKNKISEKLKISSYGKLSWFLNNKIEKTENKIMLSQEAYIEKLIENYKMSDCRTMEIPLEVISKLIQQKRKHRISTYAVLWLLRNSRMFKFFSVDYQTKYYTYS